MSSRFLLDARSSRSLAALGLVAASFTSQALADVRNLTSGVNHAELQSAIDSAAEGDTLIVGSGSFEGFTIDGKGLTLRSLPGTSHEIVAQIAVRNISSASVVQLDGLVVRGRRFGEDGNFLPMAHESAAVFEANAGSVRLYRCELAAGSGVDHDARNPAPAHYDPLEYPGGGVGLEATNCSNLALLDCVIQGGHGSGEVGHSMLTSGSGGAGLWSVDSAIAIYDSRLAGGDGGLGGHTGENGGDACHVDGLGIFASGCEFRGGDGGDVDSTTPLRSGDGGSGVWVIQGANVRLLDNTYSGGGGGCCASSGGNPGLPKFWEGGPLPDLPGASRSLRATETFVGDGESFVLHAEGQPGDRFFLATAPRPSFHFVVNPASVQLVHFQQYFDWNSSVLIGPSGSAEWTLPAWELGPGQVRHQTAQAFVRSANGEVTIGGAVLLSALDDETGPDCNGNGRRDLFDLVLGQETDCNGDFRPDACSIQNDCNGNGVDDALDIGCLGFADADGNGVPDSCDGFATQYVDASAPLGGDGSAGAPFQDLASALAVVVDGGSIEVAGGLYVGGANRNLDLGGKSLQIYSSSGSAGCTIDLQQAGLAFMTGTGSGVLRLSGFRIENGDGASQPAGALHVGTGFEATLVDCVFKNCRGGSGPGAIQSLGDLVLDGCEFDDNHSDIAGGALGVFGRLRASDCRFTGNGALIGGALYLPLNGEDSVLSHCIFRNNSSSASGGALSLQAGRLLVDNSFFVGNVANASGGALQVTSGLGPGVQLVVSNTTIADNSANGVHPDHGGGGCHVTGANSAEFHNSILWDNSASIGPNLRLNGSSSNPSGTIHVDHCDLQGGPAGVPVANGTLTTNAVLDADPMFQNASGSDYRLALGSPCVDSGSTLLLASDLLDIDLDFDLTEEVPFDLIGGARRVDDPNAPDVGEGPGPLVDMGAFER